MSFFLLLVVAAVDLVIMVVVEDQVVVLVALPFGGVTARRKRNMGRLRALKELRRKRRSDRGPPGVVNMIASEAEQSGKRVGVAKEISKA